MAIGSGENRCVFRFRVEWAMWGNMNALYAAASKFNRPWFVFLSLNKNHSPFFAFFSYVCRWCGGGYSGDHQQYIIACSSVWSSY